ncbi:neprilysin-1-like [Rhipicephalus sanguineus]|uniref:neprilysin-1-like n=1 Tax=Rhipicephalus sanguineus TaxID=34632 RepID=UPI0020C3D91A|nr:neprilysin-1-like [Rhipicephalus sanguineus]
METKPLGGKQRCHTLDTLDTLDILDTLTILDILDTRDTLDILDILDTRDSLDTPDTPDIPVTLTTLDILDTLDNLHHMSSDLANQRHRLQPLADLIIVSCVAAAGCGHVPQRVLAIHWKPATKADNFLNTCVTIVAVLIVVTLIVMGFILLKCFSIQEVCNRTITAYGDMNTSLSCESDECKAYALTMRASKLDFQEACEDFYEHVCGGWTRTAKVAPDEVFKSVARDMRRAVEDQISEILNNTVISYRDQTAAQKAAALYQGCINIDLRNSKGTKPLEDLLARYELAHWPIVNRTQQFRTFHLLGNAIRELRLDALVSVTAHLDYHNSERYILYIGQPSFGVETLVLRGRYRTPFFRILHRYKLYIYRCALLLGANVAAADIVNDIVNFEAKLAYVSIWHCVHMRSEIRGYSNSSDRRTYRDLVDEILLEV